MAGSLAGTINIEEAECQTLQAIRLLISEWILLCCKFANSIGAHWPNPLAFAFWKSRVHSIHARARRDHDMWNISSTCGLENIQCSSCIGMMRPNWISNTPGHASQCG